MKNKDSDPPHVPDNCGNCEFITDIHFQRDITHIWTINLVGKVKHYPLFYHPLIYIAADTDAQQYPVYPNNRTLHEIARDLQTLDDIVSVKHVNRYTSSSSETYVAALIFGFGLFSESEFPQTIKNLGILLLLYAGIGFFAFFSTFFALLRSLFFVIGILYASFVFYKL